MQKEKVMLLAAESYLQAIEDMDRLMNDFFQQHYNFYKQKISTLKNKIESGTDE
jgi:hypothetical protein